MDKEALAKIIFTRVRRNFRCPRGSCGCSIDNGCAALRGVCADIADAAFPAGMVGEITEPTFRTADPPDTTPWTDCDCPDDAAISCTMVECPRHHAPMPTPETTKSVRVVSAWEHDRLLREARLSLPTLPDWSFQPDDDTPGLYLRCQTKEQRVAIMRALGAPEEACK